MPVVKGGKRFNLEATCATSDGSVGSLASLSDEECANWLGTTPLAISSGSDLASLTPRQTLGVYQQARAAYWEAKQDWDRAERYLLLARLCFPGNREVLAFQVEVTGRRMGRGLGGEEKFKVQSSKFK